MALDLLHAAPQQATAIQAPQVDPRALAADLRRHVEGEVRFDDGSRALYATDASNYRQVPIGVVVPRHIDDVVETVAACRRHAAPLVSRGGGTSLSGQCCNVAVVIDFSKHINRILEIDPERKIARLQPGVIDDHLRSQTQEKYNLVFGPDPATHAWCTFGGMLGNNACGIHAVMSGRTSENVEEMEILTYDGVRMRVGPTSEAELERIIRQGDRRGEIYRGLKDLRDRYADLIRQRYPDIPRRISGYNLDYLLPGEGFNVARALVGSEGTCVTILEATVRLVHSPPVRSLLVLGYEDIYTAGDHAVEIMAHGPTGLEGIDDKLIGFMRTKGMHVQSLSLLPAGKGWLLVELGGESKAEADDKARRLMAALERQSQPPSMKLYEDAAEKSQVWEVRESGLGATAHVPHEKDSWPGWEDAAVPPEELGKYLRDFRQLLDKFDYDASLYGHFGQACVHCRIPFDLHISQAIKAIGGIAQGRRLPAFAAQTFTAWYRQRPQHHPEGRQPVLLYPDVFNDHFYPDTLKAALTALERFGYHVMIPPGTVPAIRPLLHFGMLDAAERQIRRVLYDLRPYVAQGVPVVGLEPSTVSIFRDEVPNLLPHDRDGQRLREKCYLLSEFLDTQGVELPPLQRQAILHNHCHQKAVLNPNAMLDVLTKMGLQIEEPEQGCCGMAGSFGFEAEHYDMSQQLGERHLFPAVRQAPADQLIVAEGFSCRTQIQEATARRPLHLAELLMMAFTEGPSGPDRQYPEQYYVNPHTPTLKASTVALAGAALIGGIITARVLTRR